MYSTIDIPEGFNIYQSEKGHYGFLYPEDTQRPITEAVSACRGRYFAKNFVSLQVSAEYAIKYNLKSRIIWVREEDYARLKLQ